MLSISRLDHLVLTVASIPASIEFYQGVLGFEARQKNERWSLHFGQQKINLHPNASPYAPHAEAPTAGSADLCFITTASSEDIAAHFRTRSVSIEQGPVNRTGALGKMESFYVRDPDGNLIEIARYL